MAISRRNFIENNGATCNNWRSSWSFVNHNEKRVIFGAWEVEKDGSLSRILATDWQFDKIGRTKSAYNQALEHIRLVKDEDYQLMTFPIKHADPVPVQTSIGKFVPELTSKTLKQIDGDWFALDSSVSDPTNNFDEYIRRSNVVRHLNEGRKNTPKPKGSIKPDKTFTTTTSYYRDPEVRAWVLFENDGACEACDNKAPFTTTDGSPFLEVHHLVRLADGGPDVVDNAIAVCPNCHRRLHYSSDRNTYLDKIYAKNSRLKRH